MIDRLNGIAYNGEIFRNDSVDCSRSIDCMVENYGGMHIDRCYDCRRYRMVYGIRAVKVRRRIGISSVWTFQMVFLNGRSSVSLEYMNLADGECRSVPYGVANNQKWVGK